MEKVKLIAWGGAGTVTGANFFLNIQGKHILVDCGLQQDGANPDSVNCHGFPYEPESIDFLFVTHAHMDHIGRIPKLVKEGFKGKIISTPETKALSELMLPDAARVFTDPRNKQKGPPLYLPLDVEASFSKWESVSYHETFPISHDLSVRFLDAGHILGSAMIEFTFRGEKMVFTGDLGNSPSPLLRDTEPLKDVRYLVMESVYGDRNHEGKDIRQEKLLHAVEDIILRKGTLIIPSFSLERTQVILSELNEMVEAGLVKPIPVFLDSPLSIKVTDVYRHMRENWNDRMKARITSGDEPFSFPRLAFTPDRDDSLHILAIKGPKIVIAGSGMSNGGRIIRHEKAYLPDKKNILLLVGYQSPGTLGRRIADGDKEVEIEGEKISVRAEVRQIEGYSSHKGLDDLVAFVETSADTLKKVFVTMGEPKSSMFLAQRLSDYLGVKAIMPEVGKEYSLEFPE